MGVFLDETGIGQRKKLTCNVVATVTSASTRIFKPEWTFRDSLIESERWTFVVPHEPAMVVGHLLREGITLEEGNYLGEPQL